MGNHLQGKTAVVTGASRGLGQAIAVALAEAGAMVALVARTAETLYDVEQSIPGERAQAFPCDVGSPQEVDAMQLGVEAALGTPTILVNAAGMFGPIKLIKDSDPDLWIETLMVNTVAPYLTCRAFLPGMLGAGWGRIINVTS